MNRNKLTPCRKVGLSRKKNTPLKTVETLLSENENGSQITPEIPKKVKPHSKQLLKIEINVDSPCRQVGLSRKRKISTPLASSQNENSFVQRKVGEKKNNRENNVQNSNIESNCIAAKENDFEKEISIDSKLNVKNPTSCAKKLSKLFSSPSSDKSELKPDTKCNKESENNLFNSVPELKVVKPSVFSENLDNENSSDCSLISTESEKAGKIKVLVKNDCVNSVQTNVCDKNTSEENSSPLEKNSSLSSNNNSQFIKVCYSHEKQKTNKIAKHNSEEKKTKFSILLEDDDDFDIGPIKKKPNRVLERSKTEVSKDKKSNKNKLKKSLSVGDSRSRTLTDSSIKSSTSISDLKIDCFVKLEKIEESVQKTSLNRTVQDQSDDDFEVFSCTPKETKIKNLDALEEEVKKKRQIVEELERAKLYKKMHSAEDLKKLTSVWKNGCVDALNDLLKQLNMHSYMSMEMLLKKLNIPEDFLLSS